MSTITFVHDTDQPDLLPIPDGIAPAAFGAATEAIAMARVTGSVGGSVHRGAYVATVRRLYTIEAGATTATTMWQVTVTGVEA